MVYWGILDLICKTNAVHPSKVKYLVKVYLFSLDSEVFPCGNCGNLLGKYDVFLSLKNWQKDIVFTVSW